MKFSAFLFSFSISLNSFAANYYVDSDSSFPDLGVETSVYMGDKMLEQKYVYSEQCFTPKKTFTLQKKLDDGKQVCLTSSKQIEKTCCCCFGGIRQITKDGTMCSDNGKHFSPIDFFSFKRKNGSEKTNLFLAKRKFFIKRKKGEITIYQDQGPGEGLIRTKIIKLTEDEFQNTFRTSESHWIVSLPLKKNSPVCKLKENQNTSIFSGFGASLTQTTPGNINQGHVHNVKIKRSESTVSITADHSRGESVWSLSNDEFNESFEETSRTIEVASGMQRTIEYAGIQGNLVKLIYSEFKEGLARDAFTREFTIDLSGDNVAAYKGAIFEVIKATNSTVKYKVIRNFPVEK